MDETVLAALVEHVLAVARGSSREHDDAEVGEECTDVLPTLKDR
jgi:hypothetical protein